MPTPWPDHPEAPYLGLLEEVLARGTRKDDRTGTGTLSLFGRQIRFDLDAGFPLLTTKRVHTRSIVHELLWFLRGDTNVAYLRENGVSIWDEWADGEGDLGPVYGKQWRSWETPAGGTIDQISWVVDEIRRNPDSRRLIVSAWNPSDLDRMALAPCHCLFQFNTRPMSPAQREAWASRAGVEVGPAGPDAAGVPARYLDCQLYQRSADLFLGVPFNIASYALLTAMIARVANMAPGEFVHAFGDVHLYVDHLEQARLQLAREPRPFPTLSLPRKASPFDYAYDDVVFEGYAPHPAIKAPVSK